MCFSYNRILPDEVPCHLVRQAEKRSNHKVWWWKKSNLAIAGSLTLTGYKRYCTLYTCDNILAFPFLHIHGNCDLCMIPAWILHEHASIIIWYIDHSCMRDSCMVHSWNEWIHMTCMVMHVMHGSSMSHAWKTSQFLTCSMHVSCMEHETCMHISCMEHETCMHIVCSTCMKHAW